MIFEKTTLPGTVVVTPEFRHDERGFFARTWCREDFSAGGLSCDMVQASVSHNREAGTLRGLHFSWPPSREGKLVRCESGRIHDVALDLRPDSPSFIKHFSIVLDAELRNALYIPPGVAHGFQTLDPNSVVLYMMSEFYRAELSDGARFDDPAFGIKWPLPVSSILQRDRAYPDFDVVAHSSRFAQATATATA